jgi:hypothetical protein
MKPYIKLARSLREKESRDNRDLLDAAANAIETLSKQSAAEFAKYLIDHVYVVNTYKLPDLYHDFMEARR